MAVTWLTTRAIVEIARRFGTDTADVEIKSAAGGLPKTAVETVSAFANGTGGTLILGLAEAAGFAPAEGFDARKIMDALAGACADKLEPPIRDSIVVEDFDGASVVRLDVTSLDPVDKPCHVKARGAYEGSFIRAGDGDRRLSHYEVSQLLSNRRQPTDDAQPVVTATFADLSPDLVSRLLNRVRTQDQRAFRGLTDEQCLTRLRVLTTAGSGALHPTLAGLLCLGEYPQQFFPQLFISFIALPGLELGQTTADGRRFLDNQSLNGPLPDLIEDAVAAIERNMRRAVVVRGSRRSDQYDYPLEVIRELVVNAVMHRDYSAAALGTQVQIELYPDRLVMRNPGGLWGGVEVGQLGTADVSSSRNAVLAKLLGEVPTITGDPVCENRGSGLPTVMRALRDAGMSPPEFDVSPAHVFVTVPQHALLGPDTIEWIAALPARDLTDAQHLALAMIRANGAVSNEMLRSWGVDSHAATQALTDLVGRGLLAKVGGRRYATYRLADQPPRREDLFDLGASASTQPVTAPTVDTDLAAVIEAIRAGYVTSRAIAAQLGLSYQATVRRIRKLRDAGVIAETASRHSRTQSYRLTGQPAQDHAGHSQI